MGGRSRTLRGGVLVGGSSSRMGRPKTLLQWQGKTFLELAVAALSPVVHEVVLVGAGEVPPGCRGLSVLEDAAGSGGPLAGMVAALRAFPESAWLFAPCDLPLVDEAATKWLVGQRAPGIWAIQPRIRKSGAEPLFALYEPEALDRLEKAFQAGLGPRAVAGERGVGHPCPPSRLRPAWTNVNTEEDLRALSRQGVDGG